MWKVNGEIKKSVCVGVRGEQESMRGSLHTSPQCPGQARAEPAARKQSESPLLELGTQEPEAPSDGSQGVR